VMADRRTTSRMIAKTTTSPTRIEARRIERVWTHGVAAASRPRTPSLGWPPQRGIAVDARSRGSGCATGLWVRLSGQGLPGSPASCSCKNNPPSQPQSASRSRFRGDLDASCPPLSCLTSGHWGETPGLRLAVADGGVQPWALPRPTGPASARRPMMIRPALRNIQ
jgi:hypothetical protein